MNTDTADRQQCGEILPRNLHLTSGCRGFELLFDDGTGLAACFGPLSCEIAQNPHGEPRSREGLTIAAGDFHQCRHVAYFILVEITQWFNDGQIDIFWKATDIVVTLDDVSISTAGFNPVGCNGSLNEILGSTSRLFFFEDTDELFTDDLAFRFGFGDSLKVLEESITGVDHFQIQPQFGQHLLHFFGLTLSHESGIDIDTVQLVTDRTVGHHCGHRRVDASTAGDDCGVIDFVFENGDSFIDEHLGVHFRHLPTALTHRRQ